MVFIKMLESFSLSLIPRETSVFFFHFAKKLNIDREKNNMFCPIVLQKYQMLTFVTKMQKATSGALLIINETEVYLRN